MNRSNQQSIIFIGTNHFWLIDMNQRNKQQQQQKNNQQTGFSRATYLHSKIKNKGACKAFWRHEKRFRYVLMKQTMERLDFLKKKF